MGGSFHNYFNGLLTVLLIITSIFLILLVLIQRGKGGGLAGAFGGMGGSSAFGSRAGDVFTKVTILTASLWFVLNMVLVYSMNLRPKSAFADDKPVAKAGLEGSGKSGSNKAVGSSRDVPPLPAESKTADPTTPPSSKSKTDGDPKGRP